MKQFDAIIIGSGQAGGPLAKKLALAGKKTAIIEKRWIGGTCVNDGCTPTKTWIASAKMAYLAANSGALGIKIKEYSVDMPKIKKRKDNIVLSFRSGNQTGLEKTDGLDIIFGEAEFIADKTISVKLKNGGTTQFKADQIFINTGTMPAVPEIEGLGEIEFLTSTTMLEVSTVPDHLLIVGGSYIALEFGQMFRRFGSKVTIIERSERIASREDADIAHELTRLLENEQITIRNSTTVSKFKQKGAGKITATILKNGIEDKVKCSHVLIASGRTPQTKPLNLAITGVETDHNGYIRVNERLETNIPGIYAMGDITGGPAFTHVSYNDFTIIYRNLVHGEQLTTKNRPVPYCMFTDPQLGRIGLTEAEAKKQGLNYKVAKMPMSNVGRAIETGDTRGFMKAIVDSDTKQILGAAVLGAEGGEIMSLIQMAMLGNINYEQIVYCIFAHPLYAESLNNLFLNFV